MYKKLLIACSAIILGVAGYFAILFIKDSAIPVLFPKGMIGVKERDLFVISTLLMLIVVIPVFILTFVISWKYREENEKATYRPEWDFSWVAEAIWIGIPIVIITILSILVWRSSIELDPYRPIPSTVKPITIQVVALPWKWLFIYPDQQIATVNYMKIPKDYPIHFSITADAPMNSFWVPELGGQIFAMPGMRTELHLVANHVGCFFGTSANLSGTGFAKMIFTVQAIEEHEFQDWVHETKLVPDELTLDSYKKLAEPSECSLKTSYVLKQEKLFDWIVMKYMMPQMQERKG